MVTDRVGYWSHFDQYRYPTNIYIKYGTLLCFKIYVVFQQVFPQVKGVSMGSFAFFITTIAASIVFVQVGKVFGSPMPLLC